MRMNPDELVTPVKNPPETPTLEASQFDSVQPSGEVSKEDLSSAEFPEVVVDNKKPAPIALNLINDVSQVRFKTIAGKLNLLLPTDRELQEKQDQEESGFSSFSWTEMLEQLEQRMQASARFWQPRTQVYLQVGDRLLDVRQMQELAEALQLHELVLYSIATFRRQTAINAAAAGFSVEQGTLLQNLPGFNPIPTDPSEDPLYVKMTVRSGTEIRHPGTVIVFGDVNAGGEVIADGDILVWGKLKGVAHAGAKGNAQAVIMALHLEATQLRIADFIARVDTPTTTYCPEVAHVSAVGVPSIRIVKAADHAFLKT
jgi:septum site-determining protein MinC